jgi:hypothetical protein
LGKTLGAPKLFAPKSGFAPKVPAAPQKWAAAPKIVSPVIFSLLARPGLAHICGGVSEVSKPVLLVEDDADTREAVAQYLSILRVCRRYG